jgi:uncharacterized protein YlzI (FlbEa/FlbD family)
MPVNITQSQNIQIDNGFVGSVGSFNFKDVTNELNALLIERAELFKDVWLEQLNSKKIIASGNIENVDYEIVQTENSATLNISFPYYAKFVDKGVKGAISSKNAPNSPYKFKNTFAMSPDGRKSIANWLRSGKAKVRTTDVKKYGAKGIERKFKKISDFDRSLNTLIYNIKAYGIKKRDFIEPTIKKSLEGFEKELGEAIGKTITINIFK